MSRYRSRPEQSRRRTGTSNVQGPLLPMVSALALLGLLLILSAVSPGGLGVIDQPLWQLQQAPVFWRTLAIALAIIAGAALCFGLLGLLLCRALLLTRWHMLPALLTTLVAVTFATLLCAILKDGWLPSVWPIYLLLCLVSAFFGCLLAMMLARTSKPLLGFILLCGAAGLLGIAMLALMANTLLQPEPLPIEGTTLVSADRVRLTRTLRAGSPRNIALGATKTLRLSATDINQLGAWGLSLGSKGRHLYVDLRDEDLRAAISVQWAPRLLSEPVYLNVSGGAAFQVTDGALLPQIKELRVGNLQLPTMIANWVARGLYDLVAADPRFAGVLGQLHKVEVRDGYLQATYGAMELPSGFRSQVFGELGNIDVVAVAFSEHMHLQRRLAGALDRGEVRRDLALATIVADSFALAQERQRRLGTDPLLENRLAVIALGLSLGHRKISEVVPQLPPDFSKVPRLWRQAPLQQRTDWTRHFWVSAALTVLSDQTVSVDLGYLKEELDAGTKGGSGFSFADLGADLSGVTLAKALIGDNGRGLQNRLAVPGTFDDLVPPLQDLPEGLDALALEERYGGTKGAAYRELVGQIQRRIDEQPAYAELL